MVNEKRLVDTFLRLAAINSPSGMEKPVADEVEGDLQALGFQTTRDNAGAAINGNTGNLIAFKKGTVEGSMPIAFSAHMDTVVPTEGLQPQIIDGVIRSGGNTILGADDKAGIASILEAMRIVAEQGIEHGDIQIIFSISEEAGLDGSKNFDLSMLKADGVFVFDMGRPVGGITVSAPSHDNIIAKFRGKATHAGCNPEDGINAIVAAGKAIARMKIGRIDDETTANIGVISGGVARNIVPEYCEIKGEARSRNEDKLDAQVEDMEEAFRSAAEEEGADVDVTVWRSYKGFHLSEDDRIVQIAVKAAKKIGLSGELHGTGGGSDANIFNAKGVPAVGIGVGYEMPHSVDEYMPVEDLVKSSELALELIRTAAGN